MYQVVVMVVVVRLLEVFSHYVHGNLYLSLINNAAADSISDE